MCAYVCVCVRFIRPLANAVINNTIYRNEDTSLIRAQELKLVHNYTMTL